VKLNRTWLAALPALAVLLVSSCAGAAVSDEYVIQNDPGHVEHVEGSDEAHVSLTEEAAERLRVRTTSVTQSGQGLVVPARATFVDTEGVWWVYKSVGPNEFVRHEITFDRTENGRVFLSDGPPRGTEVVSVGVMELYGIEEEVGH